MSSNLKEFAPAADPVELSGLAKHTGTFDLWYNNGPLEFRLGYKYHSPYTIIYGWNAQAISRLQTENILDASASWQITDMIGAEIAGQQSHERASAGVLRQPGEPTRKQGRQWRISDLWSPLSAGSSLQVLMTQGQRTLPLEIPRVER